MKRKILLSFMLTCMGMFTFGMLNASAYTGTKHGDYLYYIKSNGEITISDCDETATVIDIPETIDGKKVTSIGNSAFYGCSSLESVTIPNSVTSIGRLAFSGCSGLESVTIPDSVTSIGYSAFIYCGSLTSVNITDMEAWCRIDFANSDSNPLYYAKKLYMNNEVVKNAVITNNVTAIGEYAFCGCSGLESVIIPDSVTSIGTGAFSACSGLESVTIPDSVISIGTGAFSVCSGLENVTISDSVTSIGGRAFSGCSGLESITIPDSVTGVGDEAFYNCRSLASVTIPDSVTGISRGTFSGCSGLESVTIPNSVTSIGINAFSGCSSLESVTISNSVTNIGGYTFSHCSSLANVTIPNSVTSIGEYTFSGCSSLESITIPDSVTSIGGDAFSYCSSLESVIIPNSVTSIGDHAFSYCSSLESITIPNSVTSIDISAFYNCISLESVTIPDSVTSIGRLTFSGCRQLICVVIPGTVAEINPSAFSACNAMSLVFYTGSEEEWDKMYVASGNDALGNATKVYNATKKTYKFETNCNSKLEDITDYAVMTAPMPVNEDKIPVGWYDNEELSGEPVSFPYYGTAATLYAAWKDKTGLSFDDALTAKANMQYNVTTTETDQPIYYKFVPRLTGEYRFYSSGNLDTCGYLYDSNQRLLTSDGDGNNFKITYTLTAGETYYIAAKVYNGTGSFTLVTETDCVESTDTVCVTATTGEKIFITIPNYLPENASVILACYKNNALTEVMTAPNNNKTLYFIVKKDFDSARVMVWGSLSDMTPICEAEIVE